MYLLAILILFCVVVGIGSANWDYNAWVIVVFTVAAVVALQMAYFVTLMIRHLSA